MSRRYRVRENPSSALDVVLLGGLALGGLFLVQRLQAAGGDVGAALGGLLPHVSGGNNGGDLSNPCFTAAVGNTRLSFTPSPVRPSRVEGTEVVYSGQLSANLPGNNSPLAGAEIQFFDTRDCSRPFASVATGSDGRYSFRSVLASWDLDGYQVFAYFPGAQGFTFPGLLRADPAQTGVWQVVPQ